MRIGQMTMLDDSPKKRTVKSSIVKADLFAVTLQYDKRRAEPVENKMR